VAHRYDGSSHKVTKGRFIYRGGERMSRVAVLSPVSETVSFVLFFCPQCQRPGYDEQFE
jgi:hypothetical protein